jgi:hypothetical protein
VAIDVPDLNLIDSILFFLEILSCSWSLVHIFRI